MGLNKTELAKSTISRALGFKCKKYNSHAKYSGSFIGDCIVVSLAFLLDKSWEEIYDELSDSGRKNKCSMHSEIALNDFIRKYNKNNERYQFEEIKFDPDKSIIGALIELDNLENRKFLVLSSDHASVIYYKRIYGTNSFDYDQFMTAFPDKIIEVIEKEDKVE